MSIRAIVFDLDGTLIDTEKLYQRFWVEAANRMGFPMRPEHTLLIRATAPEIAEPVLRREVCPEFDYLGVRALRRTLMEAYIDEYGIEPKPGLLPMLQRLRDEGYAIGLATATDPERARKYLRMVDADGFFDAMVSASMVARGKPAPDIYAEAAHRLGVAPAEAMAVEDAPSGIRSAHAAGLAPVMIPDRDQPSEEIRALCVAVLPGLAAVAPFAARLNGGTVE
ncbi:MAG: HAD family hydrolase [Candidatus Ventricola sp.]|nr:HAD family hydrolase [Candidatus Ventricola sp.]